MIKRLRHGYFLITLSHILIHRYVGMYIGNNLNSNYGNAIII